MKEKKVRIANRLKEFRKFALSFENRKAQMKKHHIFISSRISDLQRLGKNNILM
ncbi:MAG: hypothetical protein MJZ49_07775 [Bacteroidales bacterium]|nr:hypothetical protein [Bacteroidales bacterium]